MSAPFRLAIIGAGSVGFTRKLISDLLCVPEFAAMEIALTDINQHNLDMVSQIIQRIVDVNELPAKVIARRIGRPVSAAGVQGDGVGLTAGARAEGRGSRKKLESFDASDFSRPSNLVPRPWFHFHITSAPFSAARVSRSISGKARC